MAIFEKKAKSEYRKFVGESIIVEKEVDRTSQAETWIHYYTYAKPPFSTSLSPEKLAELMEEIKKSEKEAKKKHSNHLRKNMVQGTLIPRRKKADSFLAPLGYITARVMPVSSAINDSELSPIIEETKIPLHSSMAEIADFFPLKYIDENLKDLHERRGVGGKTMGVVLEDLISNYAVDLIVVEPSRAAEDLLRGKFKFHKPRQASRHIYKKIVD